MMTTKKAEADWVADGAVEHRNGVPWYQAPVPRWLHFCRAQTRGVIRDSFIERCACGAFRRAEAFWFERNSARNAR